MLPEGGLEQADVNAAFFGKVSPLDALPFADVSVAPPQGKQPQDGGDCVDVLDKEDQELVVAFPPQSTSEEC